MISEIDERLVAARRNEWKKYWPLVACAFLGFGFYSILINALGLFVEPLTAEFGWSRTEIMSGLSISSITAVFLSPFVGGLIDHLFLQGFLDSRDHPIRVRSQQVVFSLVNPANISVRVYQNCNWYRQRCNPAGYRQGDGSRNQIFSLRSLYFVVSTATIRMRKLPPRQCVQLDESFVLNPATNELNSIFSFTLGRLNATMAV